MNWIVDLLIQGAAHIKPYSGQLAVAFVATLLVIYGDAINRTVRIFVKPYPFVLRITAFVLLCTLGYGAATVWGSSQVSQLLLQIPDVYLPLVVLAAFIVLGVLAERYHKS
jgi:hypothetical protein